MHYGNTKQKSTDKTLITKPFDLENNMDVIANSDYNKKQIIKDMKTFSFPKFFLFWLAR